MATLTETCEETLCPICREKYRVARSIPSCGHAFCEECLFTFVFDLQKRGELGTNFECPVCRNPHPVEESEQITIEWVKLFPLFKEYAEVDLAGIGTDSKFNDPSRICELCEARGHSVKGNKYCKDCKSYICINCVSIHDNFPTLKSHRMIEETDSDACELFATAVTKFMKCLNHPDRDVELFCRNTEQLLCLLCTATAHRHCDQDVDISQASKESDKIIDSLKARTASAREHLTVLEQFSIDNSKLIFDQLTKLVEDMEEFREKINGTLDKIVDKVLANKKQLKINTEDNQFATKQKCNRLKGEIGNKLLILENVLKHGTQTERIAASVKLDDEMRIIEQEVLDLDSTFAIGAVATETVNAVRRYADELNAERVPPVTIEYTIGTHQPRFKAVTCIPTPFAIESAHQHNLQINPDCCPIFSSICTNYDGDLLACDNCERKQCGHLCHYDGRNKKTVKFNKPFGVTIIKDQTIAFTLPCEKNIAVMSPGLFEQSTKSIKTEHTPMSIAALKDGTVALSWDGPPAFSISDISGAAVENKVYFTQDSGGRTFRSFDYMAVDEKRQHVIQPCKMDKAVYCFDFAGRPVFKYINDMNDPRGAAVDVKSGSVFVCDAKSHSIHQLTCAGDPLAVIKHDTLNTPLAICFDKKRNGFWVSSYIRNIGLRLLWKQCNIVTFYLGKIET